MTKLILPGRNTAEESHEKRNANDLPVQGAKARVVDAGRILCPFNAEYLGSAVVHFFGVPSVPGKPTYQIIIHTMLEKVPEGFADYGHKELRKHMMDAYGRKAPRTRKA